MGMKAQITRRTTPIVAKHDPRLQRHPLMRTCPAEPRIEGVERSRSFPQPYSAAAPMLGSPVFLANGWAQPSAWQKTARRCAAGLGVVRRPRNPKLVTCYYRALACPLNFPIERKHRARRTNLEAATSTTHARLTRVHSDTLLSEADR